jgi:hypothetical protein
MKIIIDYEDGNQRAIENVIDYAIYAKEDLVDSVNDLFEGNGIENKYDNITKDVQNELWSKVKKNCKYFESLPSMDEFRGEVEDVMCELGLLKN